MKRRDFSAQLALAAVGLPLAGPVLAQGAPIEGTHYVRLGQPVPVNAPPGKVEVIEFFWYGCPHCNTFEPVLESWVKRMPPEIAFRRVHVGFTALHETHQHLFYALEATGQLEQMHRKVFAAMHNQRRRLDREAEIEAFATENGIDGKKLVETMKSFGVQAKSRQAKQLTDAYKIDGVPALGVHGRWYTSIGLAGGPDRALAVVEYLAKRARAA